METEKQIIKSLLAGAGIIINGSKPSDIQVHNENLYKRIMRHGSIGLGESYMDGWWDCEKLDVLFYRLLTADLEERVKKILKFDFNLILNMVINAGTKAKAFEIGQRHYDLGNDLYSAMLDKRLTYTCGYWKNARNLEDAQTAKLDLICRKIGLKAHQKVLDIGSGWGSFLGYSAENYKVNVVGVTVSKEQKILADTLYKDLAVKTLLRDYRNISGKYDGVVSLGMFEHVGYKNYRTFMQVVHKVLKNDGLFLLHTIGSNKSVRGTDPWIEKYIFPNSMLPSLKQIGQSIEGLFVVEDWHNFGTDYDKTLLAWHHNFKKNWNKIKSNYDDRFYRMWRYYLLSCAGSFRARKNQLWQIVLSKKGVPGGYKSIR